MLTGVEAVRKMCSIIGNGMLASAFDRGALCELEALVFASGVSNSSEVDPRAFERERVLLEQVLDAMPNGRRLVYFGTTSVDDPDRAATPYVQHKLAMEARVKSRPGHVILRLPQVVGRTQNRHTLTNHLARRIRGGLVVDVWLRATRNLLDVDAVAALTLVLLGRAHEDMTATLCSPEAVTILELVHMLERALGCTATLRTIDRGANCAPDAGLAIELAPRAGIDLSPGCTSRTLFKYYGEGNDH